LPKHRYFTDEEYKKSEFSIYPYYISIDLGNGGFVVMRLGSYQSLRTLLDDLYMEYLKDKYEPFTYGKDWLLGTTSPEFPNALQLIVSWSWFLKPDIQSLSSFEPEWSASSPEVYGLSSYSRLEIIDKFPIRSYGVATNDPYIVSLLLHKSRDGKVMYAFFSKLSKLINMRKSSYTGEMSWGDHINIEKHKAKLVDVASYKFKFIYTGNFIQSDKIALIIKSYSPRSW